MKLFQLKKDDVFSMDSLGSIRAIVVESQNYGSPDDLLYHLAVADDSAEKLTEAGVGREIEDKGRTVGFWQNLGGDGIYKPTLAGMPGIFSENLGKVLSSQPDSKIYVEGSTWAEIIQNSRFTDEVKKVYFAEAEVEESSEGSKPAKKSTRKQGKKQQVKGSN